ncbi:MAG: hypothetical protein PW792_01115 [Acidobacteriaceae bacterium]|nr:hypothetical protein [Acidobacteriaceae bacterium]
MSAKFALQYALIVLSLLGLVVALLLLKKRLVSTYPALFSLILLRVATSLVGVGILYHRKTLHLSLELAYQIYFDWYWFSVISQTLLEVAIIYGAYRIAMKPLDGLKRIGSVIFAWVASVCILLSLAVALGPHTQGASYFATLLGQMQQGVSVLTLCLLLFVCFAARPLGLTYRSRVFGVMLGMGMASTSSLVMSTWYSTKALQSVYSPAFLVGALCGLATLTVWATYFALPEQERALVLLPTTSPYFTWNRISEALGDEPGLVAISGFRPAMLASAELKAMIVAQKSLQSVADEPAQAMLVDRIAVGAN